MLTFDFILDLPLINDGQSRIGQTPAGELLLIQGDTQPLGFQYAVVEHGKYDGLEWNSTGNLMPEEMVSWGVKTMPGRGVFCFVNEKVGDYVQSQVRLIESL